MYLLQNGLCSYNGLVIIMIGVGALPWLEIPHVCCDISPFDITFVVLCFLFDN